MNSQTLISKIVTEAMNYNPNASIDDILGGIFTIMEREVLPAVFKGVSLPDFPSWSDIVIESKKGKIIRKGPRPSTHLLKERRLIIQQIEYLRQKLDWNGNKTLTTYPYLANFDNLIGIPETGQPSIKMEPKYDGEETRVPFIEDLGKTYPSILPALKPKYQITFSNLVQEKIISNPLFERIFSKIEVSLRRLIEERNLEANVEVFFQSDIEIPNWEKSVITIKDLPLKMTFEDKMKIWEIFDLTVRSRIAELAEEMDENTRKYLKDLNRNLFVHMEL